MAFTVHGLRAPGGLEWVRKQLYGDDMASDACPIVARRRFATPVRLLARSLAVSATQLAAHAEAAGGLGETIEEVADGLRVQAGALRAAIQSLYEADAERPFRVVLMGRTMAGKSTLFEYFSLGDGSRVGDGRQRATRESCVRASEALGFDVVDTPGVGALDGAEDYEAAFSEVPDADLIVWVASDDAAQEQTGRALRQLGALGKPILVALNCRANLDDPIGWDDFLTSPELIYGGDTLGNLGPIDRYLASVGSQRLRALPLHADAALRSQIGQHDDETSELLRNNSRIDAVVDALRAERDRTEVQRRILSLCDRVRIELLVTAGLLSKGGADLAALSEASRGAQATFRRQAKRRIDDARDELLAATADIVGARERWWEDFQIDGNVATLWTKEAKKIEVETTTAMQAIHERLTADLGAISTDAADDWAAFMPGAFKDLTGYGTVWGNRAVKIGGGVAITLGAMVGAKWGAVIGSMIPGPGTIVGGAIGLLVGVAVATLLGPLQKRLDGLADRLFRSKTDIHRRRREQVRDQLRPVVREIRTTLGTSIDQLADCWRASLTTDLNMQASSVDELDQARSDLDTSAQSVRTTLQEIDTETARQLLGAAGRPRAAAHVQRATRWQGVGLAIELPEPIYSEQFLFPVVDAAEPLVPVAEQSGFASRAALDVVLGLTAGDVTVHTMTATELDVAVSDPIPEGIRQSWAALASAHTGVLVEISQRGPE